MDRGRLLKKGLIFTGIFVAVFFQFSTIVAGSSQDEDPLSGFSIGLRVFFDYSSLLSKQGPLAEKYGKGWNPFQFRRAYFTLEHKINDTFKMRFRTDADREADDKARVFIKNLYLEWSRLIPEAKLYIGMIPVPGKALSESVWGYRGIERTLIHAYKQQTGADVDYFPADLGLGLKGTLKKSVFYHLTVANGTGYGHPEMDKYKKFALQLGVIPLEGLSIAGYVDVERQNSEAVNWTYKGDMLFTGRKIAVGFEIFLYFDNLTNVKRGGSSVFGSYGIAEGAKAFIRFDLYDPVRNGETGKDGISLFILGFDYSPHTLIHLMPHFRIKSYQDTRSSDVQGVLTLEIRY